MEHMENNDDHTTDGILNPYRFPFVGCREDGEPFEYLLLDIKKDSAEIALLTWFVNRENLDIDERVDLFIPTFLSPEYLFRNDVTGKITSKEQQEDFSGTIYKVCLLNFTGSTESGNAFDELAHQMHASESLRQLLLFLIKDSAILKSGVNIYLKHFIPYFSRIVDRSLTTYAKIERHFLHDILDKIHAHEKKLNELAIFFEQNIIKDEQIPIYVDLEELRENIESEISFSLFHIIFGSLENLPIVSLYQGEDESGYSMHIHAIKNLEKRLYSNYNLIVFLYLKTL